jgi:thiamine kinase-like enzyme
VRELDERIERAVGSRPVRYAARSGGYSTADRFAVELADGRSVFVKSAEAPHMAAWLRREHEVYSSLAGSFIPRLEGWDDDGVRPVLVIEDLSDADWAPRWDDARVQAVRASLAELAACAPPANTAGVRVTHASIFGRWEKVAADPEPFLSLGLRDSGWLERRLSELIDAAAAAPVDGDAPVHYDIRSDNMCFVGDRAVLVDWNWLSLGNPDADLAGWAASLRLEGGPPPWELLPASPEFAALLAGV